MELVDVVLVAVCVLLTAAVAAVVASVVHGFRVRQRGAAGRPRLAWAVAALLAGSLVATYCAGSPAPFVAGGRAYTDALWLRVADMFILTSTLLIVICSAIVIAGRFRR